MKLAALTRNGKVKLTWDGVNGCDFYRVKRNDGTGLSVLTELKSFTYIDEKVNLGKIYYYVVVAVLYDQEFHPSNRLMVKVI